MWAAAGHQESCPLLEWLISFFQVWRSLFISLGEIWQQVQLSEPDGPHSAKRCDRGACCQSWSCQSGLGTRGSQQLDPEVTSLQEVRNTFWPKGAEKTLAWHCWNAFSWRSLWKTGDRGRGNFFHLWECRATQPGIEGWACPRTCLRTVGHSWMTWIWKSSSWDGFPCWRVAHTSCEGDSVTGSTSPFRNDAEQSWWGTQSEKNELGRHSVWSPRWCCTGPEEWAALEEMSLSNGQISFPEGSGSNSWAITAVALSPMVEVRHGLTMKREGEAKQHAIEWNKDRCPGPEWSWQEQVWHPKIWTPSPSCKEDVFRSVCERFLQKCWRAVQGPWIWIRTCSQSVWLVHPLAVFLGPGGALTRCLKFASKTQRRSTCCTVLLKTWQGQKRHRPSQVHSWLLPEARRGSARDRNGNCFSQVGGQDTCPPIWEGSGSCVCPIPVRPLSTRAGTDCVGHTIRAMTDADPECTVLSIDCVGAYDHVLRSSFLTKLHQAPSLQAPLPFVRSTYARTTTYMWEDDAGVRHQIKQAEGGEQGDPLMPLLLSLGIHDSLSTARSRMRRQDSLFVYLGDVHVVSLPDRTREAYNILQEQLLVGAGIQLHTGKTRAWNRRDTTCRSGRVGGGSVESKRHQDSGHSLGVAWVCPQCGRAKAGRRGQIVASSHLGSRSPVWVANIFAIRTLPPSESAECAQRHDDGMWQAMQALMGGFTGTEEQKLTARQLTPNAYGRAWFEMRRAYGTCSVLVFVGRCASHGPRETSTSGTTRRGRVGRRPGCGMMHWGIARNFSWIWPARVRRPPNLDTLQAWGPATSRRLLWTNGHMAGHTSRLPSPSTTTGRQQCCASHALVTRPTCGLTQEEDAPMCCMVARRAQNSLWSRNSSEPWSWKD